TPRDNHSGNLSSLTASLYVDVDETLLHVIRIVEDLNDLVTAHSDFTERTRGDVESFHDQTNDVLDPFDGERTPKNLARLQCLPKGPKIRMEKAAAPVRCPIVRELLLEDELQIFAPKFRFGAQPQSDFERHKLRRANLEILAD